MATKLAQTYTPHASQGVDKYNVVSYTPHASQGVDKYNVVSYQLKLIKMRAELANRNYCAVPFF